MGINWGVGVGHYLNIHSFFGGGIVGNRLVNFAKNGVGGGGDSRL